MPRLEDILKEEMEKSRARDAFFSPSRPVVRKTGARSAGTALPEDVAFGYAEGMNGPAPSGEKSISEIVWDTISSGVFDSGGGVATNPDTVTHRGAPTISSAVIAASKGARISPAVIAASKGAGISPAVIAASKGIPSAARQNPGGPFATQPKRTPPGGDSIYGFTVAPGGPSAKPPTQRRPATRETGPFATPPSAVPRETDGEIFSSQFRLDPGNQLRMNPFASAGNPQEEAGTKQADPATLGSTTFDDLLNRTYGITQDAMSKLPGGSNVNPHESEYQTALKEWNEASGQSDKWWVQLLAAMFPQFGAVLNMRDRLKEKKLDFAQRRYEGARQEIMARENDFRDMYANLVNAGYTHQQALDRIKAEVAGKKELFDYDQKNSYETFVRPDGTAVRVAKNVGEVPQGLMTGAAFGDVQANKRAAAERALRERQGMERLENPDTGESIWVSPGEKVPPGFFAPSRGGAGMGSGGFGADETAIEKATDRLINQLGVKHQISVPDNATGDDRESAIQALAEALHYPDPNILRQELRNGAISALRGDRAALRGRQGPSGSQGTGGGDSIVWTSRPPEQGLRK